MERTLHTDEAAKILGCTSKTLRVWVGKRRVPHVRVGRLVRFRVEDLARFLEEHQVPADTE